MKPNKLFEYLYSNEVTPDDLYKVCAQFEREVYKEACEGVGTFFRRMQSEGHRKKILRTKKDYNDMLDELNDFMYNQYLKTHNVKVELKIKQ